MITRDGRQVRIFCADGGGEWRVMGAIGDTVKNCWHEERWNDEGRASFSFIDDGNDIRPDSLPEFQAAIAGGDGWRPIETAPKDGTVLLLYARANTATAYVSVIGWYLSDIENWIECCFSPNTPVGIQPSHWRPLPRLGEASYHSRLSASEAQDGHVPSHGDLRVPGDGPRPFGGGVQC